MKNLESAIVIESKSDLEFLLKKYDCGDFQSLDRLLWYTYGISLLDESDCTEYTNIEAQNSPFFAEEGLSQSEMEEIQRLKQQVIS